MDSITLFPGQKRQRINALADIADDGPLSEVDVALMLDVSRRTVQAWRLKKTGPRYTKVGGKVRYSRADIDSYLRSRRVQGRV